MEGDVGQTVVLPIENCLEVAVHSLPRPSDRIPLTLDLLPPLEGNRLRVDLFHLLFEEEQTHLKHKFLFLFGDVGLDAEVADVVELDLLLVVAEEEGLGEEGGGGVVDGGPLDDLAVVEQGLRVPLMVVFGEGEGVGKDPLDANSSTSVGLGPWA